MKRKSRLFPINTFINQYPELNESKIEIRIDEENSLDILEFLFAKDNDGFLKHKKKFLRILYEVLKGRYNNDLYDKEEVSPKAKNVTAMKFKGKMNFRIACKEIQCKNKNIIMVLYFHKKNQKNSKKEITTYEVIGGYEYEC